MEKEKLNTLLNNINGNMKNYNEDINVRMNISDALEIKRLKRAADELVDEITECEKEFSQSELQKSLVKK